MSREDDLRALREARFMAKAKRALGPAQPEHVTKPATPATKVSATKPNARAADQRSVIRR
jgi:tRNA nucleotidyltransferase/poly(A) polymerase